MEPNRFLNREEANRRGTETTRTAVRFFFYFFETKRTQTNREIPGFQTYALPLKSHRVFASSLQNESTNCTWLLDQS